MHVPTIWRFKFTDLVNSKKLNLWEKMAVDKSACVKVCISIFNQFKLNELWPYYQKHVNQIILNHTTL